MTSNYDLLHIASSEKSLDVRGVDLLRLESKCVCTACVTVHVPAHVCTLFGCRIGFQVEKGK